MKKDIGLRGASRRDFMRGVFTASAALGLGPTKALDMLEKMGGSDLAQAATSTASLMVNHIWGNGAMSRATQLIAVPTAISSFNPATTALNPMAPGMPISSRYQQIMTTAGNPYYARIVNGKPFSGAKPWSVFVSGQSQAHSVFSAFNGNTTTTMQGGNVSLFAAAAQIQTSLHSLVPAINVANAGNFMPYSPAPAGAPNPSGVTDRNAIIGLFNSAASQLVNRLGNPNNQMLYGTYYKALMGLTAWAGRPTYSTSTTDAQTALSLVVQNLGSQLMVANGEDTMYAGAAAITDPKVQLLAQTLIITKNAFKLGLTPHVTFPAFLDDPHQAFAGQPDTVFDGTASCLDAFQAALDAIPDPARAGKFLGNRLVMTISGDTTKNCHNRVGWPDGTPGGSNLLYVQGSGYLVPGFYGDVTPMNRVNWDLTTGANSPMTPTADCTSLAAGLALYAASGGDANATRMYYSLPLGSVAVPSAIS